MCPRSHSSPTKRVHHHWQNPRPVEKILIVPLPKKHHITSLLDTRPIALLESMLKILTGIINQRTLKCWVDNKSLHPSQYAFLPGSGSADPVHIARCIYEISNTRIKQKMLESENMSKYVHVAYLDQAKAYDAVEHSALTIALRSLGVPPTTLNLLHEIDKGCTVTVRTPTGLSPEAPIGRGCRQGDPYSCLRYNAFMNGLLRHLDTVGVTWSVSPKISIHAQFFADDSMLIAPTLAGLQKLLSATHQFFDFFGLKCNTDKSYYTTNDPSSNENVHFRPFDDENHAPLTKKLQSESIRYLGYLINLDLDWSHHHNNITNKLQTAQSIIENANLTPHDAITALNSVISGKFNYLFQVMTVPPKTLAIWDKLLLNAARAKVRCGTSQSSLQIHTHKNQGGLGLILPSELYTAMILHDTHIRLSSSNLSSDLTWHRLKDYSYSRHFVTCALRFPISTPQCPKFNRNHMHAVSTALINTNSVLDTDQISAPDLAIPKPTDIEIMEHLDPTTRAEIGKLLFDQNIYYLSQLANNNQTHILPWHELRQTLKRPPHEPPPWYKTILNALTDSTHPTPGTLLPHISLPQDTDAELPEAFNAFNERSQPIRAPPPPLTSQYTRDGITHTIEPVINSVDENGIPHLSIPQVWISDGSGRHLPGSRHQLSAGCSLLPFQNAYSLLEKARVEGYQSVYKSELMALVTAAENATHNTPVYCFLDNQSVVIGSTLPPNTTRARCQRKARGLWNRFFHAIEKRPPNCPLEVIWIRGHTKHNTLLHQLHNACDRFAGEATELPMPPVTRFPFQEEAAIIYDHNNEIVEDNIRHFALRQLHRIKQEKITALYTKFNKPIPLFMHCIEAAQSCKPTNRAWESILKGHQGRQLATHLLQTRANRLCTNAGVHRTNPNAAPDPLCPRPNCRTENILDTIYHRLMQCTERLSLSQRFPADLAHRIATGSNHTWPSAPPPRYPRTKNAPPLPMAKPNPHALLRTTGQKPLKHPRTVQRRRWSTHILVGPHQTQHTQCTVLPRHKPNHQSRNRSKEIPTTPQKSSEYLC